MDVPPVMDSTLPPPGWVRIELEPVNIPLEHDDSILLSAIQSVIPGAHGLYYKDEDRKKALKYNGATGCILKGPAGWNSKPIYVVLAHGCRHFNNIGTAGQYDVATERFEKTVNLIQRMLADQWMPSHLYRKDASIGSVDCKYGGNRLLSHDAQIANESDCKARTDEEERGNGSFIAGNCSKTSIDIQKPQAEDDIPKQSDLRMETSKYNTGKEEGTGNEDIFEKLKRQKERAEYQLIEKGKKMNYLKQIISDLESKLSEHKRHFDATQDRVKDLEIMLDEERNKAQSLANLNAELNTKFESLSLDRQPEIGYDRLQQWSNEAIDEKNYEIDRMNKQINDLKWSLGEHKQWLEDANDRTNHLENVCKEKDYVINDLTNKLRDFEHRLFDASAFQSTEKLDSLINDLRKEIDEKNNYIEQLEKAKNDAQWYLGEHQCWLQDANARIGILENEKLKGWRKVHELEEMLNQGGNGDYSEMKAKMEELQQKTEDKKYECDKLNEEKDEMKVSLEKYKVWLEDAEKRVIYLENEKSEQDRLIVAIVKELEDLKEIRNDAFQRLHEKVDDLELYLNKKQQELIEIGSNNGDIEYKTFKWSAKDLAENIFDLENGHLNDLAEPKDKNDWTLTENLKKRMKELENATQRLTNEKKIAVTKLHEIEQLELNVEELKKEVSMKDQQIIKLEKDFNDKQNEFKLRIEELLGEVNEAKRNAVINEQMKNDVEWCLGEHRQWLADANNKIDELENKLEAIGCENNNLREEIEKLTGNIRASMEAIEGLQKEINNKNEQINCITKQKNDAEWNFNDKQQLLEDANNRISELESVLIEKDNSIEELKKCNEDEQAALHKKLLSSEKALSEAPNRNKLNELSSVVDCLQNELNGKNEYIKTLTKQCNDAEWNLGEHRQWLHDSNIRIQDLEKELCKRNDYVEQLRQEIGNRNADISSNLVTIDALNSELTDKNLCIENVEKAKNDAEWSLGEHRQWLQNANDRIDELIHSMEEKDRKIAELQKSLEDALLLGTVQKESLEHLTSKLHEIEETLAKAPKSNELSTLVSTTEDIRREIDIKNIYINDLEKQRNDLEWSLGEHRQWLENANERIAELEKCEEGKDNIIKELRSDIDELSKKVVLDLKAALEAVKNEAQLEKTEISIEQLMAKLHNAEQALAENPKLDDLTSLKNENENLREILKDKDARIDDLTQQMNDREWSLGEHRQWLRDCNDRANWLDSIVMAKNGEIDGLRCENDRLKSDLAKISQNADINNLNAAVENLHNEINKKNNDIDEMMKQRNETEQKLGEHRQWLEDANKRANELAGKLTEKEEALNLIIEKHPEIVEEHKKVDITLVGSKPIEVDKSKLYEKIFELETKLLEMEKAAVEIHNDNQLKVEHEMSIAKLREILDQKDADLEHISKKRSDAEWFLGEERQRLKDANQRIALLEEELTCVKIEHADILHNLRNETFELREKNKKLKETLTKTEVIMKDLSKDAKMTMLILGQTEESGNLEEEFKQLCKKYVQLSSLLATIQDHLAKLQIEASEFINSKELWKVIENLNNELHQRRAENGSLLKQKTDTEWELGEHREWLRNANNRITVLEDELAHIKDANEKALEVLHVENETLNQKNAQLKDAVKHLQDEIQNLTMDTTTEIKKHNCWECREVSGLNRVENVDEELSSIKCLLENLCKELNYQKIIDNLMEERSKAEQMLKERKESITDAYNKIVELEKQILENTLEEQSGVTERKTIFTRTTEEAENISHIKSLRSEQFIDSHEEIDEIQRQLNDKNAEVEKLLTLKSELERNLEKVTIRNEEMSALLDQKEQTINAIINEKNSIVMERNSLEQQIDNLKQQCRTLSSFGIEGQNTTELMVRLCEKEDLLQQFTTEIAEKVQEITNLHNVIKDLRDVNNEKNRIIDDLNRLTSEKEWNLGEYRQWLLDANNKIDNLKRELNDVRQREKLSMIELDKLTNEIDEKNGKISQLHNKIAKMESDAINVQYGKEMISDEHFSSELVELREKLLHMEEYVQFQDEELRQLRKEHTQTLTNEQRNVSPESIAIQSHIIDSSMMSEGYHELSSELITLNRKKYELEEKLKRVENDLQESHEKIKWLENEQRKTGEEIWLAKERVANQDCELRDLHGQCSWLRDENARLQNELGEERKKNVENGGIDWCKFDEMKNEMKQIENTLRDEKSKVEWRLGEVTQYWNDAKWKIGELEAGMAHKEWLLDQAHQKIHELDQMCRFRDTTKSVLDGAFLIKKQPTGDRYKWRLAMWNESSPDDLKDYRRIWFEVRAPTAKIVLLSASFVSWECFLLCQKLDNDGDKFGVWVDIPPGRYEFLFVVDGQWAISDSYETCWNEHGTHNNCRYVD